MKTIKFILPVIAFAMAIVSVFASDSFFANDARGTYQTTLCVIGNLQVPTGKTCSVINDDVRCQVRIPVGLGFQIVPAFTLDGECQSPDEELFYEN
jgi:hypothetical protein